MKKGAPNDKEREDWTFMQTFERTETVERSQQEVSYPVVSTKEKTQTMEDILVNLKVSIQEVGLPILKKATWSSSEALVLRQCQGVVVEIRAVAQVVVEGT